MRKERRKAPRCQPSSASTASASPPCQTGLPSSHAIGGEIGGTPSPGAASAIATSTAIGAATRRISHSQGGARMAARRITAAQHDVGVVVPGERHVTARRRGRRGAAAGQHDAQHLPARRRHQRDPGLAAVGQLAQGADGGVGRAGPIGRPGSSRMRSGRNATVSAAPAAGRGPGRRSTQPAAGHSTAPSGRARPSSRFAPPRNSATKRVAGRSYSACGVSHCTSLPASSTATRSASESASAWSCVTMTKPAPVRALQGAELESGALAQGGVERAERLVQQQQRRPLHQAPHQGHALPLPAGELVRQAPLQALQAHHRQRLGHPPRDLGPRDTPRGAARRPRCRTR